MTEVQNFVEQDKALCALALDRGRDVLLRAAEMIAEAERGCVISSVAELSTDLTNGL